MNSLVLLLVTIVLFLIAYNTYGSYVAKKYGIDNKYVTPAHRLRDDKDYCPANSKVLLGHHFSSIAGAGPITGPIQAAVFGWLPVILWVIIGSIFIGGVHDFGSLVTSMRHDGKSIGEVIRVNIGEKGKLLFNIYGYLTIILVVAAFADICASTFAYNSNDLMGAQAGTASILFIFLAFIFGTLVYRKGAKLSVATIIGVAALVGCILLGYNFPVLKFSKTAWQIILVVYIFLASTLPVWLLLQPRDYLCSFLLYGIIAGAVIGIIAKHPAMELQAFTGFNSKIGPMFPILFVTVACGAISGFHSLVASSTTSKQIDKEVKDSKFIGYGAMLIEGVVACIALCAVGSIAIPAETSKLGPAAVFSYGVATFMQSFGFPFEVGRVFVTLCYSAFALTSLDTATRIGRYLLQELATGKDGKGDNIIAKNMYVSTGITVVLSFLLMRAGYKTIWPIFGSANQLLAALAFLAITAWLVKQGKKSLFTVIPMVFMFCVTLTALVIVAKNNFAAGGNILLGILAVVLFILALVLVVEAYNTLVKNKNKSAGASKSV